MLYIAAGIYAGIFLGWIAVRELSVWRKRRAVKRLREECQKNGGRHRWSERVDLRDFDARR